jgi:hypothetical protein
MKKPKITMAILKEESGYSAFTKVKDHFISTQGDNFNDLKAKITDAVNLSFQDTGYNYSIDEIVFKYDLESFFDFYKVINAKALSKRIGMNQSLMAQYIKGIKKPSSAQSKRILNGVQQIGKELCDVRFLL